MQDPQGELIPVGGGDPIPLIRSPMKIGRRESCDICLRYSNVSGIHCELTYDGGCWHLVDSNSTNGIKVNGVTVPRKILRPGDEISIATRRFTIDYVMERDVNPLLDIDEEISNVPLLEKAGLVHKRARNDEE